MRLVVSRVSRRPEVLVGAAAQQPIEGGAARVRGVRPGVQLRARSTGRAVGTLHGVPPGDQVQLPEKLAIRAGVLAGRARGRGAFGPFPVQVERRRLRPQVLVPDG